MEKKMKKALRQLDTMPMPNKEKILAACPQAVAVTEGSKIRPVRQIRSIRPARVAVLAMAALLLVSGGLTVAAAEAKAYGEAIDFFEEYNLSAEGFTRSEVKKIYKDITSERFTYEKTEEALASGLEGYEIQAQPLDSEGLKRVWMVGYQFGVEVKDYDETAQYEYSIGHCGGIPYVGSADQLSQTKNGEVRWSIYLYDLFADTAVATADGVVVAGHPCYQSESEPYIVRVSLLNADSTQVWCKDYQSPFPNPFADYILCEEDTITLFVIDTPVEKMWIATMDMEGNLIKQEFVDYDSRFGGLEKVIPIGEDYLMVKKDHVERDQLILKKGNKIENTVTIGNGDEEYRITDMIEFNGLVYLSGRIVPKTEDSADGSMGQYDLYMDRFGEEGATDEEMLEFYRENHTAVLMICDPDSGEPGSFYTIPGASGGKLSVTGTRLTWNVNRYTGAQPYTIAEGDLLNEYIGSGYCLGDITADVWQYVFTPYGQIVGEKDTGNSIEFEG